MKEKNKNTKKKSKVINFIFWILIISIVIIASAKIYTEVYSLNKVFLPSEAPSAPVAIVFGAGLNQDGTPTRLLKDRVEAAVELYQAGKVKKLLMSGDNRFIYYDEPTSMADYAESLGVPSEDIVLDFAGRRTYDTCYRAKYIFQLSEVLLVTQRFHLGRALFECNAIGLKSTGVNADQRKYFLYNTIRETFATLVAFWEVWVFHPLPVMGNPEPIFPD